MRGRASSRLPRPVLFVGFVVVLATIYPAIAIGGTSHATRGAAASVAPMGGVTTADTARSLTPASAPKLPAAPAPANAFTDRPTMPLSDYQAAKAAANAAPKGKKGGAAAANFSLNAQTKLASANTLLGSFNATGECGTTVNDGCWYPPDVNGAVGANQLVEIVNNHIDVYTKSTSPTVLMELTTNSFFAYGGPMTDPRVEYDSLWGRWVVIEQDFANGLHFAVSFDNNLTHGWFVETAFGPLVSLDYPQLALTQDAVVITESDFAGPERVWTYGVAKALLYNGFGWSVPTFFLGNNATGTPSNVIDQNPVEHELLYFPTVGTNDVSFQNPQAGAYGSITANVPVTGSLTAVVPPDATQPLLGSCPAPSCLIDTLDGRYQNDQTQYGTHLWAIHTQVLAGIYPTPQWADIDTSTNATTQGNYVFMTAFSNDWNPSIVATTAGTVNVNWSWVTNPTVCPPTNPICGGGGSHPAMTFSGRVAGDAVNTMNPGTTIFTSPSALTGNYDPNHGKQRWGDTSSVRFDPSGNGTAWAFNETVQSGGNLWGTRGAQIRTQ